MIRERLKEVSKIIDDSDNMVVESDNYSILFYCNKVKCELHYTYITHRLNPIYYLRIFYDNSEPQEYEILEFEDIEFYLRRVEEDTYAKIST